MLAIVTLFVYWQVIDHKFVNFDDNIYITENVHIKNGLSKDGILWSFGFDKRETYWHPITWLSHMLDCQFFGLDSGMHHLISLVFHIANVLLLFLVFLRISGAVWRSAFVAALFALHPINVDSVAWIAERKNLLSTFFWMLTMLSYVYYVRKPTLSKYFVILLAFTLGLLAKPMLVTLPFVLLLMDIWPLKRTSLKTMQHSEAPRQLSAEVSLSHLILEKVPLLVLALLATVISSFSLKQADGLISPEVVPYDLRIANAIVSYVKYIGKLLWPKDLAILYPFPTEMLPFWQIAGAFLILATLSFFVVMSFRKRPYLLIGWLWYLGTLVPVSGIVMGGLWPAMADRWAYVPLIGIYIMVSWGSADLFPQWRYRKTVFLLSSLVILLAFLITTIHQLTYWKNDYTLFKHALNVTKNNAVMHNYFGHVLFKLGEKTEAAFHYVEALSINPIFIDAQNNLGNMYLEQGKINEAINMYRYALMNDADFDEANYNIARALTKQGKFDEAIIYYKKALSINPDNTDYNSNIALTFALQKKTDEAIEYYNKALQLNPEYMEAHNNLGAILTQRGRFDEAIAHYRKALSLNPAYSEAERNLNITLANREKFNNAVNKFQDALKSSPDDPALLWNLGELYKGIGRTDRAIESYEKALSYAPEYIKALYSLTMVYSTEGDYDNALLSLQKMHDLRPESPDISYNIACMYARQGKVNESVEWLNNAIDKGFNNWELLKTDKDMENIRTSSSFENLIGVN